MFSVASCSCKIWPRCEPGMKLQLDILREITRKSLTFSYANASSVQMTCYLIPIICYFLGASPSPSP